MQTAPIRIPPLPGKKATPHTVQVFRSTPPHVTTIESLSGQSDTEQSILPGECWNAVYECSYDVLTQLLNDANPSELPSLSDDWDSPLTLNTEDEKANYPPLAEWLDRAASASPTVRDAMKFYTWDRPLETPEDKKNTPEPDGIAVSLTPLLDLMDTWNCAAAALEVKGDWPEALKQAFTCARKLLNAGNRWLAALIAVNHKSKQARFVIATHMGIVITCATSLETSEGRRPLAQIVHSLSNLPPDAAGLDTSVIYVNETLYFALPTRKGDWSWWRVVKVLCKRETLCGNATRVYKLMREEDYDALDLAEGMEALSIVESAESHSQRRQGVRFSPRDPQNVRAVPRAVPNGVAPTQKADSGDGPDSELQSPSAEDCKHLELDALFDWGLPEAKLPSTLILKDAYPLEERAKMEAEFLTAVQDQHGFAPILGAMTVKHGFADFAALEGLKRCGQAPEAYSGLDDGAELSMELRAQRRLLSTVEGKPLSEASALDVVYACVDCMIGIYNAYSLNWLHRDISSGNVLLRLSPEARTDEQVDGNACLEKLEVAGGINMALLKRHLRQCKCVIIDGDAAVRMVDREFATLRSGTMEFMSIRGLRAWAVSGENYHCILDDMEAVMWLLVYTLVARKPEAFRTIQENLFLEMLSNRDARHLAVVKAGFIGPNGAGTRIDWTNGNDAIAELVLEWQQFTRELGQESEDAFTEPSPKGKFAPRVPCAPDNVNGAELNRIAHKYFARYLNAGVNCLQSMGVYDLPDGL